MKKFIGPMMPIIKAPIIKAPIIKAPIIEAPIIEAPIIEAPKKINQGKIAVVCDEIGYASICAAMKAHGISDATPSNWNKIRNGLKKNGTHTLEGHIFSI